MACSKLMARCALFAGGRGGGSGSNGHHNKKTLAWHNQHHSVHYHHHNSSNKSPSTPANILTKVKDTVLVVEATKGRGTKVAMGLCQAGAAAALVYSTGYALTLLTTGHQDKSPSSAAATARHNLMLVNVEHDFPVDDHHLVDPDAIIRHLEDRKNLSDRRVFLTYFHALSSLLAAGLTSILSFRVFKNKSLLVKLGNRPLVTVAVGVITPFLMSSLVRNLPRTQNIDGKLVPFGIKELGHLLYAGTLGLIAAPLYLLGGQSMGRAAFITAGCMAGLHCVEKHIPKDALLNLEKPLIIAINAVLVSFLLTLVLPQSSLGFKPIYRFMMHGGLLVYSVNYMYALQKMEKSSRSRHYDPVNAAMNLSMNLLNIFGRLAFMLPPYFQVCREHMLVMPAKRGQFSLSPRTTNKPGNSTEGGDGGGGSGV